MASAEILQSAVIRARDVTDNIETRLEPRDYPICPDLASKTGDLGVPRIGVFDRALRGVPHSTSRLE
jgi:hypothetical protein